MNFRLKRFIETTSPMIIGYGLVIASVTLLLGIWYGLVGIIIFSIVDVVVITEKDVQ